MGGRELNETVQYVYYTVYLVTKDESPPSLSVWLERICLRYRVIFLHQRGYPIGQWNCYGYHTTIYTVMVYSRHP